MSKHFKLKRGFNIRLKGAAQAVLEDAPAPKSVAVKPTDFPGLTPKLSVKADAQVKAGDALFFDKYNPEILFTSPVSRFLTKPASINGPSSQLLLTR